mgnify:CR=1 FL=1
MEIKVTEQGTFELLYDKLDIFIHLLLVRRHKYKSVSTLYVSNRMGNILYFTERHQHLSFLLYTYTFSMNASMLCIALYSQ